MRTNYVGFALAASMGLIVLLLGLLALSVAGLVSTAPAGVALTKSAPADTTAGRAAPQDTALALPAVPASLLWRTKAAGGDAAAVASGDALFKNNCAQCHTVNDKVVGPALGGIAKRRPIGWLVPWVKNSSKVIAGGDEYAVKLFTDNGKQQMPAFPQLTAEDVQDIMVWVSSQEVSAAATVAAR